MEDRCDSEGLGTEGGLDLDGGHAVGGMDVGKDCGDVVRPTFPGEEERRKEKIHFMTNKERTRIRSWDDLARSLNEEFKNKVSERGIFNPWTGIRH
jgi:hypothetical protein